MAKEASRDDSLRCSFCTKSQKAAGKLLSSPSDYPRAYICDECVAVCAAIIQDDRGEAEALTDLHPLLGHPAASDLMVAVTEWIRAESRGGGSEELARVRELASRMIAS